MKSSFLSTENILHTYILILFILLECFDHLFFSLPPIMEVLELQRQHDRYCVVCPCQILLTVSEAQLVESEGGYGEDPLMMSPQGTQTAWGSN